MLRFLVTFSLLVAQAMAEGHGLVGNGTATGNETNETATEKAATKKEEGEEKEETEKATGEGDGKKDSEAKAKATEAKKAAEAKLTEAQKQAGYFWEKTFAFKPEEVNPCILPGTKYKFLNIVSMPQSKLLPFGGSCVVLGQKSFFIFGHVKPVKTRFGTSKGYIAMHFRYVTTAKTVEANYGTSYEAYENQDNPLVRFTAIGEEKFKELRKKDTPFHELEEQATSYGMGLKEKVCAKLAGLANICTGVAPPAKGRRLQDKEGGGSLVMSMDVTGVDKAKKSTTIGEMDKNGAIKSVEKMEFKDGDAGMSDFKEAKEFDPNAVKKAPATNAGAKVEGAKKAGAGEPGEEGDSTQAAVASAVVTHGSAGLALVLLFGHAFSF